MQRTKTKRRGVAAETLDLGLTSEQAAVYAKVNWDVDFVDNDAFYESDAEDKFFGNKAVQIDEPVWECLVDDIRDIPVTRNRKSTFTGREEEQMFLRYNYARMRMKELLQKQLKRNSMARAKQIVKWQNRVNETRSAITASNMGLVMAMAKRTKIPYVDFPELISEGNMALLRSIDKFDVSRGFKFSTYACRAILKSYNRLATKTGRYRQHFPVEFDPSLERSDYDVMKHEFKRQDSLDSIKEIISYNLADLSDTEKTVVVERFALDSGGKGRTLAQVGEKVGLTNERVRQIQLAALSKIRNALDKHFLVA